MNMPETPDEMAAFIISELQNCQEALPPLVPDNGRVVDGEHASACALRSMATAMLLRKAVVALRAERDALAEKVEKLKTALLECAQECEVGKSIAGYVIRDIVSSTLADDAEKKL